MLCEGSVPAARRSPCNHCLGNGAITSSIWGVASTVWLKNGRPMAALQPAVRTSSWIRSLPRAGQLGSSTGEWVIGKGRRPFETPPFREVYRRHTKLRKAIQSLLTPPVQPPQRIDLEKDPAYEEARKLLQAIRALDKRAAKNLSSEYLRLDNLAKWCERIPISDWDDPRQLRRLARFYVANTITWQVWEIRYKSDAPGRPLNLLTTTTEVPDPDFLKLCDPMHGDHDVYYVAATLPRWHIVWKSSWNHLSPW